MPRSGWPARIVRAARAPSSVWSGGIRMSIDREVRIGLVHGGDQRRRVRGLGHDVVPGVDEQAGQALAEQRGVLTDHDAHGSTASTTVPSAGRAGQPQPAAGRGDPVGQPGQSGAGPQDRAAGAVVVDPDGERVRVPEQPQADARRLGVPDRVHHRLAGHVVGGGRDHVRQAAVLAQLRVTSNVIGTGTRPTSMVSAFTRPSSRLLGRRPWAICRSSATAVPISATAVSSRPLTSVRPSSRCRWPRRSAMPSGDQSLLGAVVQVAFEPAAFLVRDGAAAWTGWTPPPAAPPTARSAAGPPPPAGRPRWRPRASAHGNRPH